MPIRNPLHLLACGAAALCLLGCNANHERTAPSLPQPPQTPQAAPTGPQPTAVWSQNYLQQKALENQARQLLRDGKFAEIEQQAAQFRHTLAEFPDGRCKLFVFYDGLSDVPEQGTEADWQQLEKRVLAWRKSRPQSITAQIAVAMTYYNGAFLARGHSFAYKVKDRQWELMNKRIAQSFGALKAAGAAKNKCPGWHLATQYLVFASGLKRETQDLVTNNALKLFPDVTDFHLRQVHYLMDRWHGEPGDWQAYAAKVARSKPGETGDILYARAVWHLIETLNAFDADELKTFDWPRTKRGFEALMKKGDPYAALNAYAVAAWLQRDRPTLKRLMQEHFENKADPSVWKRWENFSRARQWAMSEAAEAEN